MTATAEKYTLNLDTRYANDVGQVLGLRKRMERGLWEPEFLNACFQHITPRDTVFEIGTWIGPYSVIIGKYIGASRVIGFEPDPVAFRQCVLNLNLNQVKNVFVLPFAMADAAGSVSLFTNRIFGNSGSSIFQNNPATQNGAQEKVEVPCVSLDKFVEMSGIQPTVIKLDVEGAEDLVLAGGKNTLRRKGVKIFIEIHHEYLLKRGKSANTILNQLSELGKTIYFLENDSAYPYKLNEKVDPAQPIAIPNFHVIAY